MARNGTVWWRRGCASSWPKKSMALLCPFYGLLTQPARQVFQLWPIYLTYILCPALCAQLSLYWKCQHRTSMTDTAIQLHQLLVITVQCCFQHHPHETIKLVITIKLEFFFFLNSSAWLQQSFFYLTIILEINETILLAQSSTLAWVTPKINCDLQTMYEEDRQVGKHLYQSKINGHMKSPALRVVGIYIKTVTFLNINGSLKLHTLSWNLT